MFCSVRVLGLLCTGTGHGGRVLVLIFGFVLLQFLHYDLRKTLVSTLFFLLLNEVHLHTKAERNQRNRFRVINQSVTLVRVLVPGLYISIYPPNNRFVGGGGGGRRIGERNRRIGECNLLTACA